MEDLIDELRQLAAERAAIVRQEAELWSRVAGAFQRFAEERNRLMEHQARLAQSQTDYAGKTYMTTKQAAEYLGVTPSTMHAWRSTGGGPVYAKMGRSVRYKVEELDNFAARNTYPHTSAYGVER